MILTALTELAEREGLSEDPDFEPKALHYLVEVTRDGRIAGFRSTMSAPERGKGKPRPKKLPVPRHSGRTSASVAEFLCDKAEYVFGIDPTGKRSAKELEKRRTLFLDKVRACAATTHDQAVEALLQALDHMNVRLPDDVGPNSLFGFVFESDYERLISDRARVREYWRHLRRQPSAGTFAAVTQCLITGAPCVPVDKHPSLNRIPGANPAGAALVSFNMSAFESYGLERNQNAPISRAAAEAYTTALNRLLDPAYPNPADGAPLPRRNVRLSDSSVAVFWSREDSEFVDLFADIDTNPRVVLDMIEAPNAGRQPVLDDPQAFYAAVLSGAQGRVVLRQWIETTIGELARNVGQHFEDLSLLRAGEESAPRPLWLLLRSMAVLRKLENIPPGLAAEFFASIVSGARYPRALLDVSVRRMRAEQEVPAERAALIKAYLTRARRLGGLAPDFMEVRMALDEGSPSVPYRLGRLFAVLERLQVAAVNPSATIRDRYFGAASANPVTVFPRLLRGAQPHISKTSSGSYFQKLISEIVEALPARALPATLTLEDQGLFAIGYYHQRQAFHAKGGAEKSRAEETSSR